MNVNELRILYEDNHLIAVVKPSGVLVQGDASGELSLMDYVKEYLKEKYKKPGNVFLGLIHRLDKSVSGIVLFAKTSKGASRVSEQFRNREVSKKYVALLEGNLPKNTDTVELFLKKDEQARKANVFETDVSGSQKSSLSYKVLRRDKDATLVEVELYTGRFHQIRATFAHLGHSILGDAKYGAKHFFAPKSIALWATELSFRTATDGKEITLLLDPNDFLKV